MESSGESSRQREQLMQNLKSGHNLCSRDGKQASVTDEEETGSKRHWRSK